MKRYYLKKYKFNICDTKKFNELVNTSIINLLLMEFFIFFVYKKIYIFSIILGFTILIKSSYTLISNFINKHKTNESDYLFMILDFVLEIIIVIYFIYIIPDEKLRNITTAIVAAVFGGLITLVGVAWTINNNENIRRKDEKQKIKPIVSIVNHINTKEKIRALKIDRYNESKIIKIDSEGKYKLKEYYIWNSDKAYSYLLGIIINNKLIKYEKSELLKKDYYYMILNELVFNFHEEINDICILLSDVNDNFYSLETFFEIDDKGDIFIEEGTKLYESYVDFDTCFVYIKKS